MFEEKLTFDDVLLVPGYSDVLPIDVDLKSRFSRNIRLNLPFVSAAMDTVTESDMAIAIALEGGLGVIHKNMTPEKQAEEVAKVKEYIVDLERYPNANIHKQRLIVAAAVGPAKNMEERVERLIESKVDVLVVDTAHGHSKGVIETIKFIKNNYSNIDVVGGNIATAQAARDLIDASVDGLKVGIGPGSICTTRIVAGVGVPQLSAIIEVVNEARRHDVPVIADGGLRYSGDIAKAFAAGASSVMMGSLFAGTEESPGEVFVSEEGVKFKSYRGMGSLGAMNKGGNERYAQANVASEKFVPEGVEARILYKGFVRDELHQLAGGLRSSMGYIGASNLISFRNKARFVRITGASLRESHPHDVEITKQAPNYKF